VTIVRALGKWLLFDDDAVSEIKESDIPRYFGDSNAGSAYVLYYQAVDIDTSALGIKPNVPVMDAAAAATGAPLAARVEAEQRALREPVLPPGLGVSEDGDGSDGSANSDPALPQTPSQTSTPRLQNAHLANLPHLPHLTHKSSSAATNTPSLKVAIPGPETLNLASTTPTVATPGGTIGNFFTSLGRVPGKKEKDKVKDKEAIPVSPVTTSRPPTASMSNGALLQSTSTFESVRSVGSEAQPSATSTPTTISANGSSDEVRDSRTPGVGLRPPTKTGKEKEKDVKTWFGKRKSFRQTSSTHGQPELEGLPSLPASAISPTHSGAASWQKSAGSVRTPAEPPAMFTPSQIHAPRLEQTTSVGSASLTDSGYESPLAGMSTSSSASAVRPRTPPRHSSTDPIPPSPSRPVRSAFPGMPRTAEHKRSSPALTTVGRAPIRRGSVDSVATPQRPSTAGASIPSPVAEAAPPVPPLPPVLAAMPSSSALGQAGTIGGRTKLDTLSSSHVDNREEDFGTLPALGAGLGLPPSLSNGASTGPRTPASQPPVAFVDPKPKRASRKLSFSGGMLGFGKKKDKDRVRDEAQVASFSTTSSVGRH
jgi:ubiquitin carboxyl-terminal hydrolase 9/13